MCTAISYHASHHYFGRNLDLEYGYQEQIVITPRNYPFQFRHTPAAASHFAMIGMATVADGFPLYYEATNEFGLSAVGLNFPKLARYNSLNNSKRNIATFEFIPWLLCHFKSTSEVKAQILNINLTNTPFSAEFEPTPLHWMVADKDVSIVIESTADGLKCYDNPIGVLTNAPVFPYQLTHLADFQHLSPLPPDNRFAAGYEMPQCSGAMGSIGLPGDWSSASRFVRAAFVKANSPALETDAANVNQFFRILQSVAMPMGSVQVKPGLHEITRYSCCCNTETGRYYYTTYHNSSIRCIDMHLEDLDRKQIIAYPLLDTPKIILQNQPQGGFL